MATGINAAIKNSIDTLKSDELKRLNNDIKANIQNSLISEIVMDKGVARNFINTLPKDFKLGGKTDLPAIIADFSEILESNEDLVDEIQEINKYDDLIEYHKELKASKVAEITSTLASISNYDLDRETLTQELLTQDISQLH